MSLLDRAVHVLGTAARGAVRGASRRARRAGAGTPSDRSPRRPGDERREPQPGRGVTDYDVARLGLPPVEYRPADDGDADPGEVVWAWVPYEEGNGQGKDRPVLILTRHDGGFLGLQLTSKDHDRDREDERRWGRSWMDVGSGAWDARGRESEARLDRVLFLPVGSVRREGAALDADVFVRVRDALLELHGR